MLVAQESKFIKSLGPNCGLKSLMTKGRGLQGKERMEGRQTILLLYSSSCPVLSSFSLVLANIRMNTPVLFAY